MIHLRRAVDGQLADKLDINTDLEGVLLQHDRDVLSLDVDGARCLVHAAPGNGAVQWHAICRCTHAGHPIMIFYIVFS